MTTVATYTPDEAWAIALDVVGLDADLEADAVDRLAHLIRQASTRQGRQPFEALLTTDAALYDFAVDLGIE